MTMIKISSQEPLSINILNELSEKVYLSPLSLFLETAKLQKSVCITRKQADSILDRKKLPVLVSPSRFSLTTVNMPSSI